MDDDEVDESHPINDDITGVRYDKIFNAVEYR
jgi:hypothetical protein